MDRAGHIKMNQAFKFEVAGRRELHGIRLRAHDLVKRSHYPRIHAHSAIEANAIRRSSGTSDWDPEDRPKKRLSYLAGREESYRVNFSAVKVPADAVICMNPKLVLQEGY